MRRSCTVTQDIEVQIAVVETEGQPTLHIREQVLFFEGDEECLVSYADKKGKYQKQESIVLPRM